MSNYNYRDHKTPHGIVEERYDEDDNFIYYFTLYRPKEQTEPLTMAQIGEIIETLINQTDEFHCAYDTRNYSENVPINLPIEIAKFQAQLMQQKYEFADE